ncbi:hypothetical protein DXV75_16820 [Alteromonas aestuariivivens]|uniref:Uncharacterized protein n=1 Tax=Alteromonas aestuariivivens TaxID=1938339 RepID=A0A3D8M2I0_9ALTE|nr:hypothetical protein [Alteromonas aestuariivivens]RDV23903.1 hypothetical protein DXV75_16820 [Alteromonas aestuariivivens]
MRFIKIIVLLGVLTGCVNDYSENHFDLVEIETAAIKYLSSQEENGSLHGIQLSNFPVQIANLDPERVYLTDQGLYIQLDSFFVQESGLFVPNKPLDSSFVESLDPKYTRLSGSVFSYIIRG